MGGAPEVEWVRDTDAKSCMCCGEAFKRFRGGKHHCRHCGRVVCGDCSPPELNLVLSEGEKPQRVCVDCNKMLTRKERERANLQYKIQKELDLIEETSLVSSNILKVYFLDTNYKKVMFDDTTTCADVVNRICHSVRVALFEVNENLKNPEEYSLIPRSELIMNVVKRWENTDKPRAKVVLPLYDVNSSLRQARLPAMAVGVGGGMAAHEEVVNGGAGTGGLPSSSSSSSSSSAPVATPNTNADRRGSYRKTSTDVPPVTLTPGGGSVSLAEYNALKVTLTLTRILNLTLTLTLTLTPYFEGGVRRHEATMENTQGPPGNPHPNLNSNYNPNPIPAQEGGRVQGLLHSGGS